MSLHLISSCNVSYTCCCPATIRSVPIVKLPELEELCFSNNSSLLNGAILTIPSFYVSHLQAFFLLSYRTFSHLFNVIVDICLLVSSYVKMEKNLDQCMYSHRGIMLLNISLYTMFVTPFSSADFDWAFSNFTPSFDAWHS